MGAPRVTIGLPGDNLGTPLVVPAERRLRSVDDDTVVVDDPDAIICCPREARGDGTHDPSCRLASRIVGPATSADLLELDAVPDPVDSDAPGVPYAGR